MAKQKFSLAVAPTFSAPVDIPVPGKGFAELKLTFKHRDKDEFKTFLDRLTDEGDEKKDEDLILEIATGWDLDEPFDVEHVREMLNRFIGSGSAILNAYIREQTGARQKN